MTQDTAPQHSASVQQQRFRKNLGGENAARAILGMNPVSEAAERRQIAGRFAAPGPRNNYSSPTEFLAGPRQPPRVTAGIRRNPNANSDHVGQMLTDEFFMAHSEGGAGHGRRGGAPNSDAASQEAGASYGDSVKRGDGAARAKKERAGCNSAPLGLNHHRDGLANNCSVTAAEKEWRSGVKVTHPQGPMDPPYSEHKDSRPPRDAVAATGKRRLPPPVKDSKLFGQAPPPKNGEDHGPSDLPPCHKSANKANESVDVLNLYCYSAEELNEAPVPVKQLGPRKFDAPDMPAAKPVAIKPIHGPARQEHDVLGTGRWGIPEKQRPQCLGRGACRPARDTANLFAGGIRPASEEETSASDSHRAAPNRAAPNRASGRSGSAKKREDPVFDPNFHPSKQLSKKNAGSPQLLRYYDPSVDAAPAPAPKHPVPRSQLECKTDDSNTPMHRGRARGEFANNSRSTVALI